MKIGLVVFENHNELNEQTYEQANTVAIPPGGDNDT